MDPSVFQSSFISLALSWIFAIPLFISLFFSIVSIFFKLEEIPWFFSVWLGLCVLIFSPLRYLLFLVFLFSSYPVQSIWAFLSTFLLAIYVPIIYGILAIITAGIPLAAIYPFIKNKFTPLRGILAALILPIACAVSSMVFFSVLPLAGMTLGWLKVKDIIKATNGPASLVFKYFVAPYTPMILPSFYDQTPQKDIDLLRCHVAAV